jgi:KDO2-lipid IV(A) lauroyltransferase
MTPVLGWLLRRLSTWPLWLLHALGVAVGWATYLSSPTYRRRFVAHAALADVTPAQRRAAVGQAGRAVMELPRLWLRPLGEPIEPAPRWSGARHIEAAHARGRGIVFLTPHLGSFEVTAQGYAERFGAAHPVTVLYRPARKAWLRGLVDGARARPGLAAAPATLAGVRQMIRALRRGEAVGLLPDQVPPQGLGVWAPFFGQPAYTMTLSARLARQTGAQVLLVWGERLPRGRGYRVHVRPWTGELPAAPEAAASQVNARMEALIRECPSQYLWGYARYKTPRGTA